MDGLEERMAARENLAWYTDQLARLREDRARLDAAIDRAMKQIDHWRTVIYGDEPSDPRARAAREG